MSTSYLIFTIIVILLLVFLYLSWTVVSNKIEQKKNNSNKRRDFLYTVSYAVGAVGVGAVVWPLIDQMNPDASVKALATTEIDLSNVEPGKSITVLWRGKPVFIRRRTDEEIEEARSIDLKDLKDPQSDKDRVQKPEWLVMIGV